MAAERRAPVAGSILVVDDVEDNRLVVADRLAALGLADVTMASSGEEALAALREKRFDLVLLDVMMPGMDGVRVLEILREEGLLPRTPVIMLSAAAEADRVVRSIELGAEDYLTKPLNGTLFAARVRATLEKKALNDFARGQLDRLEAELATARQLQLSMMPAALDAASEPVVVHAMLEPAHEVGGDLCDFFRDGAGGLWFAVGDVSGKGAAAALFMARTWSLLRSTITDGAVRARRETPGGVLGRISDALCVANQGSMFTTLLVGRLDEATGTLAWANGGHLPPFLLRAGGAQVLEAAAPQLPAGAWHGTVYETRRVRLEPGDAVFVYTDGLTEAAAADGSQYGETRLLGDLAEIGTFPGDALLAEIRERVGRHSAGQPQTDDITALVARRRKDPVALAPTAASDPGAPRRRASDASAA